MPVPLRLIQGADAPPPAKRRPNGGAQGFCRSLMEEMRAAAAGDEAADQSPPAAARPSRAVG